ATYSPIRQVFATTVPRPAQRRPGLRVPPDKSGSTGGSWLILLLCEHVAAAADRDDATRLSRIVFDDGANARDMYIDGAVERFQRFALELLHQCLSRQHAAGVLRQCQQQRELIAGQFTYHAINPHRTSGTVDLQSAETQHVGGGTRAAAPQD